MKGSRFGWGRSIDPGRITAGSGRSKVALLMFARVATSSVAEVEQFQRWVFRELVGEVLTPHRRRHQNIGSQARLGIRQ